MIQIANLCLNVEVVELLDEILIPSCEDYKKPPLPKLAHLPPQRL